MHNYNYVDIRQIDLSNLDKDGRLAVKDITTDWNTDLCKYNYENIQNSIDLAEYLVNYHNDKYVALKVIWNKIKETQTRKALATFENYFENHEHVKF